MEARTVTRRRGWAVWVLPPLILLAAVLALLMFQQPATAAPADYGLSVGTGSGFSKTFTNQCGGADREITVWYPGGPGGGESGVSSVTVTGRYPNAPGLATFVAVSTGNNCSRVVVETVRVVALNPEAPSVPPPPTVEAPNPEQHRSRSSDGAGTDDRSVVVRVSGGGFIKEGVPVELIVIKESTETVDGEESLLREVTHTCVGGKYYYGTQDVIQNRGTADEYVSTQYYITGCIKEDSGPPEGQLNNRVTVNDNQVETNRITRSNEELYRQLREAEDRPGKIYTIEVCSTHRRVDGRLVANVGEASCNHEANWKIFRKVGCIADDSRPASNRNPLTGTVPTDTDTMRYRMGTPINCTT